MDLKIPKASTGLSDTVDELRANPMQVSTGQDRVETHLPHAENSMSTYRYRPLLPGHIRCLTLHPGTRESDVEVSLLHFSLQDDRSSILKDMESPVLYMGHSNTSKNNPLSKRAKENTPCVAKSLRCSCRSASAG
jgi:hypothetical protein